MATNRTSRSDVPGQSGSDVVAEAELHSVAQARRLVMEAMSAEDFCAFLNDLPPVLRRALLGSVGARAATTATRSMASQLLARLRGSAPAGREAAEVVFAHALRLFDSGMDEDTWAKVVDGTDLERARAWVDHPDHALVAQALTSLPSPLGIAGVLYATERGAARATFGARLLGLTSWEALEDEGAAALQDPQGGTPTGRLLWHRSPTQVAIALGVPVEATDSVPVVLASLSDVLEQAAPDETEEVTGGTEAAAPDLQELGCDVPGWVEQWSGWLVQVETGEVSAESAAARVGEAWAGAVDAAVDLLDGLEAGQVPDVRPVAELARAVGSVVGLGRALGVGDREAVLVAVAQRVQVSLRAQRAWLERLASLAGPAEIADPVARVAAWASEAAVQESGPRDELLAALLKIVDVKAGHVSGVGFADLLHATQVAGRLGEEYAGVVAAAGMGMLTVSAPDAPTAEDPVASSSGQANAAPDADPSSAGVGVGGTELDPVPHAAEPGVSPPEETTRAAGEVDGDAPDEPVDGRGGGDAEAPQVKQGAQEQDHHTASDGAATNDAEPRQDDEPSRDAESRQHDELSHDENSYVEPSQADEPVPADAGRDQVSTTTTDGAAAIDLSALAGLELPAELTRHARAPQTAQVTTLPGAEASTLPSADAAQADPALLAQDEDPQEAVVADPLLDAALISQGRFALAGDVARVCAAPQAVIDARCLGAYATHLKDATGDLAAAFATRASRLTREDLAEDRPGQVLAWAAAAKAALLAPSAGPAQVLAELGVCVADHPALVAVTDALLEVSRAGVVVVAPESAAAAGVVAALESQAATLSAKARQVLDTAQHRTIKYLPANDVYTTWISPTGPLGPALTAVAEDDAAAVQETAEDVVRRLRGRAERNVEATFKVVRGPSAGKKIVAQPLRQLIHSWDEIVNLTSQWVAVRVQIAAAEQAAASGSWHTSSLDRLRRALAGHRETALGDLETICAHIGITGPGGPVALLRETFEACDGLLPTGGEPPVAFVEHHELLGSEIRVDARTLALPDPAAACEHVLALASEPARAVTDVYADLAARGALDLATALVEGVRATDTRTADQLAGALRADKVEATSRIAATGVELAEQVDLLRVAGSLGDAVWGRAAEALEALTAPSRLDIDAIEAGFATLRIDLETEQAARIAEFTAHVQELAEASETHAVAEHQDALVAIAASGQVSSAQEQLQQVLEGNPILTGPSHTGHLPRFFPVVPDLVCTANRPLEGIGGVLKETTGHTPLTAKLAAASVDLLAVPVARRAQAREAIAAFVELSSSSHLHNSPRTDVDRLRLILAQAGWEFTSVDNSSGGRENQKVVLGGVRHLGKALVPALGSEKSPDGTLTVRIVRRAATPASVVEQLADAPRDRTVLVLWATGQPITADQWRRVAETARGRTSAPPVLFLDTSVLLYLCAQDEPRLSTFAEIALPFTAVAPYQPDRAGSTAPEMFYGRTSERIAIVDMTGSSFVSGGRQLGKSALLRHAADVFASTSSAHLGIVTSLFNVGSPLPDGARSDPGHVWGVVWAALSRKGVVSGPPPASALADAVHDRVLLWLGEAADRQLLLLLDEADDFLDADAQGNQFTNVEWFRQLMLEAAGRFKVVLAGLHNTARFAGLPNQPLSHLGRGIVVGPLRPQHARDLLVRPLTAIGYSFESEIVVAKVLSLANNMPAQLQLIGRALVSHMAGKALGQGRPPTTITADDVDEAFTASLREDLREKFTLTLALDARYKVIAYVVAQAAHEHGPDTQMTVAQMFAVCKDVWPAAFAAMSGDAFRGLVGECVALGVLARDGNGYRLRTPSVRRLLGTEEEVFDVLAGAASDLTVPGVQDASAYRQVVGPQQVISPLTERQVAEILGAGREVVVVAGSGGTGIKNVGQALEAAAQSFAGAGKVVRCPDPRPEAILAAVTKATGTTRVLVDLTGADGPTLSATLARVRTGLAGGGPTVSVVTLVGPGSAAAWATDPHLVTCERIDANGVRLLAGADVLPLPDPVWGAQVAAGLGGWPWAIAVLVDALRDKTRTTSAPDTFEQVRAELTQAPGLLWTKQAGLHGPGALGLAARALADLTTTSGEDLETLAGLLAELADPALEGAVADDGFTSHTQVVTALVALGVLAPAPQGPGTWHVEPVLAADLLTSR